MSDTSPTETGSERRGLGALRRSYSLIQALGVLALLIIVMQIANERFLSPINISNLLGVLFLGAAPPASGCSRDGTLDYLRCASSGCPRGA